MRRITRRDVDAMFARVAREGGPWNYLEAGSATYGRAWKVAIRDPQSGGLSRVEHIGTSAREAYLWLHGAATALAAHSEA